MNWNQVKQIELKYRTSLKKITKLILNAIKDAHSLSDIVKALKRIYNNKKFQNLAHMIAGKMITHCNIIDSRTWRDAARANSKSKEIYEALQKTLNGHIGKTVNEKMLENAKLIKTIPLSLAEEITKFVGTKAFAGIRASEVAKTLEDKIFQYTHAKANTIARTETSKAMGALTEARAKDVGCNWYIWKTANDGLRVRESHRHMQDVICSWDDPPSPEALVHEKNVGKYSAGGIYNCRCFCRPVIGIDNITFPCKVYRQGRIMSMTKEQFKKIM